MLENNKERNVTTAGESKANNFVAVAVLSREDLNVENQELGELKGMLQRGGY